ncbi:olfactory receptor 52N2-like [Chelonia mydas]|uniref:olfactory receptor 52N2-like n=1 Tax=Chelonia mydas TaxID=8469 RepID=UPI0018A1D9F2|nr:olfactory receptor 52N2-like [Chelonia mydas]
MHIAVFDIEVHLPSCCPFTLLDTWSISEPNRRTDQCMAAFNLSDYDRSSFILTGIPGLEAAHSWISIPFFMFYVIGLLENVMVLFVVGKEEILHAPMHLLLCMLGLTEISASTAIVPKALCIFWFNLKRITVGGCLTQMFFLHVVSVTQSAILMTMALDRYVAICKPLRYATILTNARIAKLGLVCLTRAVLFILPLPLLLSQQTFCASCIIPHTYCDHMAVAKMSCGDIKINRIYIFLLVFIVLGFDLTVIAV